MSAELGRKPFFAARPASPARLADAVSDAIAAALFDGRIAPGEPLPPEGEIARELGVSKPIAREALRQLTSAGLVFTQQGKVARAKALDGESLERIYGYAVRSSLTRLREANEMRRVIETGIVRLAAQRREAAGMAAMQLALNEMRTDDLGKTWSGPTEHETLGRRPNDLGGASVVCDFTPMWHAASGTLLGTGHTAMYNCPSAFTLAKRSFPS